MRFSHPGSADDKFGFGIKIGGERFFEGFSFHNFVSTMGCVIDDRSSHYLIYIMSDRNTTRRKIKEWDCILLNSEPDWVQYKGLWGVKSWFKKNQGPSGPKWDRPKKDEIGVNEGKRCGNSLDWLIEFEKYS